MEDIVVGIDLGTTNSCVSIFMNNKLKLLENKEGTRVTPSYIFFNDQNAVIVGQYAKRLADSKPEYGIYEIKRLVGRKYNDLYVQKNLSYLPFEVKNIANEPAVVVHGKNQIIKKSPQELCTYILQKIKNDTEFKLGHRVTKAVITVPAYFNIAQREVTLAAANKAGFTVLKLLNEPTAAALHYYYKNGCSDDETFSLVYDLGGGTFDVAVLKKVGSQIDILGVDGDSHLGGHDFDNLMVEHVCEILVSKYNFNPKNDRRSMRRLKNECEEVKKSLSFCDETTIILTAFLTNPSSIEIPITRSDFENMGKNLFAKTMEIVDRCLQKTQLSKKDIREVIMSGGSTRIPKIQSMLRDYFNGKTLNNFINPDECVAKGAALQAAMLSKEPSQKISQIKVTDVTALSLGISDFVDAMTFVIKRNTPIPTSKATNRVNIYNNQTSMTFDIYEGERADAKKNHFLGVLELSNLTPAAPGQCSVSVSMIIDQNGILTVSATETVSNKTKDVKIVYTRGSRSDSEIRSTVVDAFENQEEDERFRKFAEIKGYLINYCVRVLYNLEQKNLTKIYEDVYERCTDVEMELRHLGLDDEKRVSKLKQEIVGLCSPLEKKYKFVNTYT